MSMHVSITARRALAALAACAVTGGLTLGGGTSAQAADLTAGAHWGTTDLSASVGITGPGGPRHVEAGLMSLDTDHDGTPDTLVYCIEPNTPVTSAVNGQGGYYAYDWDSYRAAAPTWAANKGRIAALLANSYPRVEADRLLTAAGLESDMPEAYVAATVQQAVWSLTNGLGGTDGSGYDWDVSYGPQRLKLYSYLLDSSAKVTNKAPAGVAFTSATTSGEAGGLIGPITLKSTTPSTVDVVRPEGGTLPAGVAVTDADGAALDGPIAGGTEFYVRVPAGTQPGSALLSATVAGADATTVPVGTVWDNPHYSTQALITARNEATTAVALTTVSWTAATDTGAAPTPEKAEPATAAPSAPAPTAPAPTPLGETVAPRAGTPVTAAPVGPAPAEPEAAGATPGASAPRATTPAVPASVATTDATPKPAWATPGTPVPTTPASPSQTPRRPAQPVHPATPIVRTPTRQPVTRTVTRTFQVDRYTPKTAAQAQVVARLDDDRRLRYREDRALWGASTWQIVTVRVPVNATRAQVTRAINATTSAKVGDVRTGSLLRSASVRTPVTVAWELGTGADATHAWGTSKRVDQVFFARS